jgi:hypothetical protein
VTLQTRTRFFFSSQEAACVVVVVAPARTKKSRDVSMGFSREFGSQQAIGSPSHLTKTKESQALSPPPKETKTMLPFPPASFRAGPALALAAILLGPSGRAARAQSCYVNVVNLLDAGVQATVFNGGDSQYDDYYTQADIAPSGCKCDIILQGCAPTPG